MNDELVLEEVRMAKNTIADAESELTRLMSDIQAAPRAEKTTISEALHSAFQKLRDAREHFAQLETLIRGKDA
ncbi:MAG TPA: hypothetical protein VKU41_07290 [Polyangiaceae bacterium]|nr:hypothetical protein [Polyangiaceae bacterium]